MNKIVKKFLLAGDKFMPELYLIQPGFTYSACRTFTKHHEWIQKFRETGNLKHLYKEVLYFRLNERNLTVFFETLMALLQS